MSRAATDRSFLTDHYFTTRARAAWAAVSGPTDTNLSAIADWARTARADDTRNRGIVVTSDGRIVAHTVHSSRVRLVDAWYVDDCDIAPDIANWELGLAMGSIGRAAGAPVVHLTFGQLCLGAGR